MGQDEAMRARVAGRERVSAATAWELKTASGICWRAVKESEAIHRLEMKDPGGAWKRVEGIIGAPETLLTAVARLSGMPAAMKVG